jgi:WD40 repeat protein
LAAATARKLVVWRLRAQQAPRKHLSVPIPQRRISARVRNRMLDDPRRGAAHPKAAAQPKGAVHPKAAAQPKAAAKPKVAVHPKVAAAYQIVFDPGDRWLDLRFGDQRMRVDLRTKEASAPQASAPPPASAMSRAAAVSADGKHRLTLQADGSVILWDAKQGTALQRITRSRFVGLAFHPFPGEFLMAADGTVYFWSILPRQVYEKAKPLFGIRGGAKFLYFSRPTKEGMLSAVHRAKTGLWRIDLQEDGTELCVSRQADGSTRTWKLTDPAPPGAHALALKPHLRAAMDATQERIAFVYGEREVRIVDAGTGALIRRYRAHRGGVTDVGWSHDGRLVTASLDGTAHLWDPSGKKKPLIIHGRRGPLHAVTIHPKGGLIATGAADGSVALHSSDKGLEVKRYRNLGSPVTALRYSPDGRVLAAGTARGLLVAWDRHRVYKWMRFWAHDDPILLLTHHPSHHQVCSSTARRTRCWPVLVDMKRLDLQAISKRSRQEAKLGMSRGRLHNALPGTPRLGPSQ